MRIFEQTVCVYDRIKHHGYCFRVITLSTLALWPSSASKININQNNTRKWQRSIYWKGLGIGVHFHQKYRMCKQIKSRFSNSHATWEKCKNFHFIICYLVEWWMYVVQSVCFTWWNIFTMPSKKSDERVSRFFAQVFFILITYRAHVLN